MSSNEKGSNKRKTPTWWPIL